MKEERKLATIFFSDLTEFTKLCEKIDPEEVKEILESIFSIIEENTNKYGGKLVKIIGDCAMCVFGVPKTLETSAENALLAIFNSYQIIEEIMKNLPHPVKLHTGVHMGEVLYEESEGKIDVLGDAVNVASRLKDMAGSGEIVVSREVYKKARHVFEFEKKGQVKLKGKENPVEVFLLKDKRKKRGKIRGLEGVEAPLVGRDRELDEILNSFEIYKEKKEDFVILIRGELGIGKTRLYEEFKKRKNKEGVFYEGRSIPTEKQPFLPIILLLKSIAENKGKDIFEKIFPDGKAGFIPVKPFTENLLEGEMPESLKSISPREFKRQKFFVVESILRKLSEKENLVLCFEDIHWADEETIDFLKYIFTSIQGDTGIFFVLLTRPPVKEEVVSSFLEFLKAVKNSKIIELDPLKFEDCMKLIDSLLTVEKLPDSLKRQILFGKSEGNPFFIEEIIKVLIERGIIYKEGNEWKSRIIIDKIESIPSSIEEIIISRVDSLNDDEKHFLKIASTIGSRFFKEGVDSLLKREVKISGLINSGFVEPLETKFLNFREYQFKHILIQEAVYKTLLKKERKHYHLEFAKWLEEMLEKGYEVPEGIIADHFEREGDLKKAFIYNERYVLKCRENYANFEAIRRYKKLLDIALKLSEFKEKLSDIYCSLGNLYSLTGRFKLSLESLRKALEFAEKDEEKARIFKEIGSAYQRASFYNEALFYLDNAEKHAGENPDLKFYIFREKAWNNFLTGNLTECRNFLKRCGKLIDHFKDEREKLSKRVLVESLAGSYHIEIGELEKGIYHYKNALEIYEKLNDISGKAVVYNNLGSNLYKAGKITEAMEMLCKSLEIDKNIGSYLGFAITCNNLGEMHLLVYDIEKSESFFKKYLRINQKIKNRLGDGYGNLGLAEIRRREGKIREAEKFYLRSMEILEEVKSEVTLNRAKVCLANFYIDTGREEKGAELIKSVKEYALKNSHIPALFCSHLLYAKYHIETFLKTKDNECIEIIEAYLKRASEIVRESIKDKISPCELYRLFVRYYKIKGDEFKLKEAKENYEKCCMEVVKGIKNETYKQGFLKHRDLFYFIYS